MEKASFGYIATHIGFPIVLFLISALYFKFHTLRSHLCRVILLSIFDTFVERVGFAIIFPDLTQYTRKFEIRNPRQIVFRRWCISEAFLRKPMAFQIHIFSKYVSGVGDYRKLEIRPFALLFRSYLYFVFGCRRNFNYMKGERPSRPVNSHSL